MSSHRSIETVVIERQILRHCIDCINKVRWSLCPHRGRGLNRRYLPVGRFVRACTSTYVEDGLSLPQSCVYLRSDDRVRLTKASIAATNLAVIDVASTAILMT